VKSLILSDLHLGSPVCRGDKIIEVLRGRDWKEVVVNGDLLDSGQFHRYNKNHWKILSELRKLSKSVPVHLVAGNHDRGAEMLANILGIDYLNQLELEFKESGEKILITHGDSFDYFILKNPILSDLAGHFYYFLQRIPLFKRFCPVIKKTSKSWHSAAQGVMDRAAVEGARRGFSHILLGHTHKAEIRHYTGIICYNSGSFCDDPSSYLEIDWKREEIKLNFV
jgi:UDP-2,3-diacylglucosamine pyrophosphatase LpxH